MIYMMLETPIYNVQCNRCQSEDLDYMVENNNGVVKEYIKCNVCNLNTVIYQPQALYHTPENFNFIEIVKIIK